MTRTLRLGFALLIAGALGACSSLIPDQAISNAFFLDGVQVTATADGFREVGVRPTMAATTHVSGAFQTQVFSAGFGAVPGFVNVASISDVITIYADVELSSPGSVDFAASYTITAVSIGLVVTNAGATVIDQTWDAFDVDLTVSGDVAYDPGSDTTSGTYRVDVEVPLITLLVQGRVVDAFVDALQDGATLDVAGAMALEVQPSFPLGAEMTFTLKSLGGTLTF